MQVKLKPIVQAIKQSSSRSFLYFFKLIFIIRIFELLS